MQRAEEEGGALCGGARGGRLRHRRSDRRRGHWTHRRCAAGRTNRGSDGEPGRSDLLAQSGLRAKGGGSGGSPGLSSASTARTSVRVFRLVARLAGDAAQCGRVARQACQRDVGAAVDADAVAAFVHARQRRGMSRSSAASRSCSAPRSAAGVRRSPCSASSSTLARESVGVPGSVSATSCNCATSARDTFLEPLTQFTPLLVGQGGSVGHR